MDLSKLPKLSQTPPPPPQPRSPGQSDPQPGAGGYGGDFGGDSGRPPLDSAGAAASVSPGSVPPSDAAGDASPPPFRSDDPAYRVPHEAIDARRLQAAREHAAVIPPGRLGGDLFVDVLLGVVIGGFFLLLGRQFISWLLATASGRTYATGMNWSDAAQTPVAYWDLLGGVAWTECGFAVLGAALVVDSLLLLVAIRRGRVRKPLVVLAVALGCLGLVANGIACFKLLQLNITPMLSFIAFAGAAFLLIYQARLLRVGRVDELSPRMT